MKICVIGNCQIAALRPMLQAMHGDLDIRNLPAVHTMRSQHSAEVEAVASEADWIVAQLVAPDYPIDFVTTASLKSAYGNRVIAWPNLYFSGYAPEYNTLRSTEYRNFSGPLLDYHSDKILIGFVQGWTVERTVDFLQHASDFDEVSYGDVVNRSLVELKQREQHTDVAISDFIERHFTEQRLFHIMNHPATVMIEELAARILQRMGESIRNRIPAGLFSDTELLSAWHPENTFVRQKYGFEFPACRLYRGVRLVRADNILGAAAAGPKIYNEEEMVEAMFTFYSPHRSVLLNHPRVQQVLDRYSRTA